MNSTYKKMSASIGEKPQRKSEKNPAYGHLCTSGNSVTNALFSDIVNKSVQSVITLFALRDDFTLSIFLGRDGRMILNE